MVELSNLCLRKGGDYSSPENGLGKCVQCEKKQTHENVNYCSFQEIRVVEFNGDVGILIEGSDSVLEQ